MAERLASTVVVFILMMVTGLLLVASQSLVWAQADADHPTPRVEPPWAAFENAQAAHGQRFVDAVQAFAAKESDDRAHSSGNAAYVMIELPAPPASNERPMVIGFNGVRADVLAKFYAEACKGTRSVVELRCPPDRFTITITPDLPRERACQLLEGLLLTACRPQS
jgi:hypothetical protein